MDRQRTEQIHPSASRGPRILRLFLVVPLLLVGLLVVGMGILFVRSDVVSFRPRLSEIRRVIEAQKVATPRLPPFLIRCLHAGGGVPDHFTARCLLVRYGLSEADALHWHTRTFFWSWSMRWHLCEEDRDLLYCACLNDCEGQTGIHHLSLRLHGKPVEKLTEPELAALAVASRSPNLFLKDRARLNAVSEDLLRRVKDG